MGHGETRGETCLLVNELVYLIHFPDRNEDPWLRESTPRITEHCIFALALKLLCERVLTNWHDAWPPHFPRQYFAYVNFDLPRALAMLYWQTKLTQCVILCERRCVPTTPELSVYNDICFMAIINTPQKFPRFARMHLKLRYTTSTIPVTRGSGCPSPD